MGNKHYTEQAIFFFVTTHFLLMKHIFITTALLI